MTEADILAATYMESASVYRPWKGELASGETVLYGREQGKMVYENIPCALSSQSGGGLSRNIPADRTSVSFSLFVRPEVEIEPGDYVVVNCRGKMVRTLAGLADRKISHNKVPLILEQELV